MKVILFAILLASAYAASDNVEIMAADYDDKIQNDEVPIVKLSRPKYTKDGYAINYNLRCSNQQCFCNAVCVPWQTCNCACPPQCPPAATTTTTTTPPPVLVEPKCENGASDWTYPDCCFNGGQGEFCCLNGANNLHCCLNGANNPWCSLPTQPPPVTPPGGTPPSGNPPGNDCNQCRCQPCMPWVPCAPCPCQQQCGGASGWGK